MINSRNAESQRRSRFLFRDRAPAVLSALTFTVRGGWHEVSSFCTFVPFVARIFTIARLEIARFFLSIFFFFFSIWILSTTSFPKGQTDPFLPYYQELFAFENSRDANDSEIRIEGSLKCSISYREFYVFRDIFLCYFDRYCDIQSQVSFPLWENNVYVID